MVDQALANNEVWGYDGWKEIAPAAKEHTLHLIGLLSDGGVHSRYDQLLLTIKGVRPYMLCIPLCPETDFVASGASATPARH